MDDLSELAPDTQLVSERSEAFKLFKSFNLFIGRAWRNTGLDPYEFTVLMNLVSRMDEQYSCYPSIETLCQECQISRRKIFDVLKSLREKNFLAWVTRTNTSNLYLIIGHPKLPFMSVDKDGVRHMHPGGAPHAPLPVHHVHPKVNPSEVEPTGRNEGGSAPLDPPLSFPEGKEELKKEEILSDLKLNGASSGVVGAQRPLSAVDAACEAEAILSGRPRGMPPLSAIKTELARMGFPQSDAYDVYDSWLSTGFRTKSGPVKDWKAALSIRARRGWLLSQQSQRQGPARAPAFTPPTEAEVLAWARAKHPRWTISYAKWCYRWFIGRDWRYYGRPVTSTAQWQALMETELMKEAPG